MARLVALRHCGESESVPGCLFHGTGTRCRPFSVTRPETQTNAHAQGKPDCSEGIPSARAMLWGIKSRQCFFERDVLSFFSFPILFIVVSTVQGIHIHGITEHITHLSSATNDAC